MNKSMNMECSLTVRPGQQRSAYTVPPKIPYPLVVVDFRFNFAFLYE